MLFINFIEDYWEEFIAPIMKELKWQYEDLPDPAQDPDDKDMYVRSPHR